MSVTQARHSRVTIVRGSGVNEAGEILNDDLAYTSVLTVFQTLDEKGHVRHEQEGKAYRYHPEVTRRKAQHHALEYVLDRLCDDSPAQLLAWLMEARDVDGEALREALEGTRGNTFGGGLREETLNQIL